MVITLFNEDETILKKLGNLLVKHNFNFVYVKHDHEISNLSLEKNKVNLFRFESLEKVAKTFPLHYKLNKNITLNLKRRCVYNKKKRVEIPLSTIEFKIICTLLDNLNSVVTTDLLLDRVWGIDDPIGTDNLYVYINRLRKKIELNPKCPSVLITHRKYGYELKKYIEN